VHRPRRMGREMGFATAGREPAMAGRGLGGDHEVDLSGNAGRVLGDGHVCFSLRGELRAGMGESRKRAEAISEWPAFTGAPRSRTGSLESRTGRGFRSALVRPGSGRRRCRDVDLPNLVGFVVSSSIVV